MFGSGDDGLAGPAIVGAGGGCVFGSGDDGLAGPAIVGAGGGCVFGSAGGGFAGPAIVGAGADGVFGSVGGGFAGPIGVAPPGRATADSDAGLALPPKAGAISASVFAGAVDCILISGAGGGAAAGGAAASRGCGSDVLLAVAGGCSVCGRGLIWSGEFATGARSDSILRCGCGAGFCGTGSTAVDGAGVGGTVGAGVSSWALWSLLGGACSDAVFGCCGKDPLPPLCCGGLVTVGLDLGPRGPRVARGNAADGATALVTSGRETPAA